MSASITIRPFEPGDQVPTRRLILDGLGAHFGFVDETINPDLDDIASSYSRALFLVAVRDGAIVGTGALVQESDGVGRVQRMSTAVEYRRTGIATGILTRLVEHARAVACPSVILETNSDWDDAIGFYEAFGFGVDAWGAGGVRFALEL